MFLFNIHLCTQMPFCSNCGQQLFVGTEKFCPNCGKDLKGGASTNDTRGSISIQGVDGDAFGIGISGSGNLISKKILVGSDTINVSQQELSKIPAPTYANALKDFSESINDKLTGKHIPEEQVKEVNNNLNELAKEVQDIKPGEEKQITPTKKSSLNGKFESVIRTVLKVLPTTARIASSFTPLAPFSSLIGETVEKVVADYTK
jgi:flagellar hook-length control protein FliK